MYVFGNGESRTSIDINKLDSPKIGCNAIHRDYKMDHLVCVDRRMVKEAIEHNVNDNSYIYTRDNWISQFQATRIRTVPNLPYEGTERWDEPFQWGSGPYAVLLAAKLSKGSTVSLIGFDLHSKTKLMNNIYKGTPNYEPGDKRAVDPRYWIHQIGQVFKCFPKVSFVVYNDNWELPKAWIAPNVTVDTISNIRYNSYN